MAHSDQDKAFALAAAMLFTTVAGCTAPQLNRTPWTDADEAAARTELTQLVSDVNDIAWKPGEVKTQGAPEKVDEDYAAATGATPRDKLGAVYDTIIGTFNATRKSGFEATYNALVAQRSSLNAGSYTPRTEAAYKADPSKDPVFTGARDLLVRALQEVPLADGAKPLPPHDSFGPIEKPQEFVDGMYDSLEREGRLGSFEAALITSQAVQGFAEQRLLQLQRKASAAYQSGDDGAGDKYTARVDALQTKMNEQADRDRRRHQTHGQYKFKVN